ncbi:MAG: A24 family peptidase [Synergistaceae bacterium]|jgi:leader peptidase (prepilin peptidase)/N-methyltransferase|nr:A24 family peptidase [Synergistaceae bacterium]
MGVAGGYNIIISILFAFAAGTCAGSFINAAAMRTVAEKKWWGSERSVCDKCGHVLGSLDLVPIASYVLLGGKCRYCKTPIKPRHFVAEMVSGILSAALFWRWGFSAAFGMSLIVLWFSLFNSLTDFDNGYIYDIWALAPGVIGLLVRVSGGWPAIISGLLGAALGFGFIALIIIVSRGGMGWGDAMLMAGIGAAVGWKYCAFGLYVGFLVGGIVVVPLMLAKKLKRKDAVPLGPFLAIGSVTVLFIGDALVRRFGGLMGGVYPGWPWG